MNYIKHLSAAFIKMTNDTRLTPYHVSLYHALFQFWNHSRFKIPFSINRAEVMKAAHIGSVNTYIKSLKELHAWGYLIYSPSSNPTVGSTVSIIRFDNHSDNHSDNNIGNEDELSVSPYINSINNTKLKTLNREKEHPPSIEDVIIFFKEKKSMQSEAEKFFHHYQSNGWLVGRVPMKDWKAAAEKWLLNAQHFKSSDNRSNLHSHNDRNKDYSESL
jgi:hypothetical protein